jgi:hypothetical protein
MRKASVLFVFLLVLLAASSCAAQHSESLELYDRIADAAIRLQREKGSTSEVTYSLTLDTPSLVAIVPSTGVDRARLPSGATQEQVSGLIAAATVWSGRPFVSITWSGGTSTGPTVERQVSVPRQMSVLKPARSTVVVRLARDTSGVVSITDLK